MSDFDACKRMGTCYNVLCIINNFKMRMKVGEVLGFAWDKFKENPVQHILVFLAVGAAGQLATILLSAIAQDANLTTIMSLNFLRYISIDAITGMFVIAYSLHIVRGAENSPTDILKSVFDFDMWWKYLLAGILMGLAVSVGLLLLIVPGIILALGLIWTQYMVVDYKKDPIEALKSSWELSKGKKWDIFLLIASVGLINLAGLLALIVGLLVSIPVSTFAVTRAYDILSSDTATEESISEDEDEPEGDDESSEKDENTETGDEVAEREQDDG